MIRQPFNDDATLGQRIEIICDTQLLLAAACIRAQTSGMGYRPLRSELP